MSSLGQFNPYIQSASGQITATQKETKLGQGHRRASTLVRGPTSRGSAVPCEEDARSQAILWAAYLILAIQLLIWDVGWKVCVQESTKGQPVIPAAAEVCDVDILKERRKHISNTH